MDTITFSKDIKHETPVVEKDTSPLGISRGLTTEREKAALVAVSLANLVGQWKQFNVASITTSQGEGSNIRTNTFTRSYYEQHFGNATTLVTNELPTVRRFYNGFRCDVEILVEQVSMHQQQGCTIVNTTCYPGTLWSQLSIGNRIHQCRFPRTFMQIGDNKTRLFRIPWASNLAFWPFDERDDGGINSRASIMQNGVFRHSVFSPLRVAEGVTDTVTFRYWHRLVNLELSVYEPRGGAL